MNWPLAMLAAAALAVVATVEGKLWAALVSYLVAVACACLAAMGAR